jgi:putative Mn2+ efflux pump MntP
MGHLPYDVNLKTTFWVIAMIYLGIVGIFMILNSMKKEEKASKSMARAYALFIYFYIVARIFYIFSDYERDANAETLLYYRYVACAYIFQIIGLLNIIFILEKYVITRSKHVISYIILVLLGVNVVMIFFPNLMPIVRYINYVMLYSEVALLIIIYLFLVINTTGDLRKKSLLTVIAFFVMITATILEIDALSSTGLVPPYYSPIVLSIGATIFAYAQSK